ncbi:hypothetical protein COCSUDRAFT_62519 [Coccomyxa subellipsoidea C-169]|uniref:SET domain-containing protein n=1 Tax=Coccomyxa subellipsoidea (strain C-169) TaxID=574566 RepID=I0Z023_COCSC|nr:hypothetical protein COCSUDRAFT_62519 [Coccomyxa subellipsoidea C-169]EIE23992.1 hypothetical protein COCSUDRAFT_62519 [Coccomyxa subellipsoidea C-169]|eukprot:XP_005648536.1 hypothetical protein COCSUDRAFT_62519 [Coccomyxa subellipsoidea C-169]
MILPPKLRDDPIKCTTKELGTFARETCLALRLLQCKRGEPPFQSNWEKFIGPQAGEDAHILCMAAKAVGKSEKAAADAGAAGALVREEKAAAEAVCQVFTNALEVLPSMPVACACNAETIHRGQPPAAMYSLISRLNHSCRANTAYHFKAGGAVVVRAVVDIDPDEELCISYLDPLQPLSRRQEDLQQRFCFTCSCERCTLEQQMLASTGLQDGTPAHAPTWFLSAIAPNAVGTEVDSCLTRLTRQAEEEFVRQGNATAAWTALEAGILQAVEEGAHPYHYRCLALYACLVSAYRVSAKLGAGRVALLRAAMYTLLQAGAAEAVLAVGEYGAMPQAAGDWSEAGGLLCEVLAAELADLKHTPAQSTPPASVSSQGPVRGSAQDQNPSSTQRSSGRAGPLVDALVRQRANDGTAGQRRGASEGNESLGEAARMSGEEDSRPSKRSRVTGTPSEPATVYWPDVLQAASGQTESRRTSPRKSVPEPPAEFAAGVCAAWAALSATCKPPMESADRSHGNMAGGDPEQDEASDAPQRSSREGGGFEAASHWEGDISDLRTLAGPAGFLSCSQPPPSNAELREALQKELNGSVDVEENVRRLEHIGIGAILCMAHATSLLRDCLTA